MKSLITKVSAVVFLGAALASCDTMASDKEAMYKVTITNISHGEFFTPIMVASHKKGVKLFELGAPASSELEIMAESGNTAPLAASLIGAGKTLDVAQAAGALPPGHSVSLMVRMDEDHDYISVTSMLVPSNDAFFALNGVKVGKAKKGKTFYSAVYDAGSEVNDELCASIPGPGFICEGEGVSDASGEGYVHVSPGIQGVGDLDSSVFDWRNPAAKITVVRIKN